MDQKSIKMLEYGDVLKRLAAYSSFSASAKLAETLRPETDVSWIRRRLSLTSEGRRLLSVNDNIRLGGCTDLRPWLDVARKYGSLDAKSFVEIAYTLSVARDLYRSFSHHEVEYPGMAVIAENLIPPAGVIERINATINDRGDVLDSASEKLGTIRREIHVSYNRLLGRLEKILKESRTQPMLQEAIITQRNGRYVIPLKAEYRGQLKAIVHDQSASGATLFVEPLATVEMNNAYLELQLAERNEVLRVLQELTSLIGTNAAQIAALVEALAEMDFVLMCAKYADDLRAAEPILAEPNRKSGLPVLRLFEARHPLLPSDRVVPIDVVLDDQTFAVVITGPNTGGKTVSLKTIGLLILMAQSGLHVPVQSGSELSLFKNVFADIGDEQSIEQSLSTFSGHITNIVRILNQANARTMVLLDELGSGTDPQEGAALARALLQYLTQKRIPCFVATHFSELKAFAHITPGVANASMEFDLRTLRPTYRLSIGLPGRSNALLIAERLGLPAEILAMARETIDPAEVNAETLLDEIYRQHDAARKARSQADRMRSLAERDQRLLQKKLEELEHEKEKILQETHNETEEELNLLRQSLTKLRREYDRARLPLAEIKLLETELKETVKTAKGIDKQLARGSQRRLRDFESEPLKIGEKVRVRSLGTDALAVVTNIEKDEVEILLGSLRMRIPQHDVMRKMDPEEGMDPQAEIEAAKLDKNRTKGTSALPAQEKRPLFRESPGTEIDLRGKTAEEIIPELETYLDNSVLARLPFVRIIHGKGTGKLRQVTRRHLLDSPYVKYIESGGAAEGGEGVTIAHLRE